MCSCAQTVQRGMTVDIGYSGAGRRRKMSLREKLRELEPEFGSVTRRSGKEPAETGEEFVLERVISCGSGDRRWGTKLDVSSCESFDDLHGTAALGTVPETVQVRSA